MVNAVYFPRLKEMRKEKNLGQKEIAAVLGISQTVYSRYERGARTIPTELLIKLADLYETSIDYLVDRTDYPRLTQLK